MSERRYEELARRLCAAFVSHHMGVTYQTAEKYLRDDHDEVGKYWYRLAEQVTREVRAEQYAKVSKVAKVKAVSHLSLVKPRRD